MGSPVRINFERRSVNSFTAINGPYKTGAASFGERFTQDPANLFVSWYVTDAYDGLGPDADMPLRVVPGMDGENLALVKTEDSIKITGIGPAPDFATGYGSVGIEFDESQVAVGFKLFSLGGTYKGGLIRLHVFDTTGEHLTYINFFITGASRVGLCSRNGLPVIGGVSITNEIPDGIAIDDIKFGHAALIG